MTDDSLEKMPPFAENLASEVPVVPPPTAPAAEPEGEATQEAESEPTGRRRDAFEAMQRRIAKLFAQKKAAEEAAQAERDRVKELEERLAKLELSRTAPTVDEKPGGDIRAAIQEAIQPLVRRIEELDRTEALSRAHEQSWLDAEEEWPELGAPGSPLAELAQEILFNDPELLNSMNGPYRAVAMAKGILASQARGEAEKQGARSVVGASPGGASGQLRDIQRQYSELLKRGVNTYEEYALAKELRAKIQALSGKREE